MNKNVQRDALMNACISFGESLKAFIKDPKSGRAAHVAAQCLFDVRKLENAIAEEGSSTVLAPPGTGVRLAPSRSGKRLGAKSACTSEADSVSGEADSVSVSEETGNSLDTAANEAIRINVIPPVSREDLL